MSNVAHYKVEHWAVATAQANYKNGPPVEITVNDRAATRQAVINRVRQRGLTFVERSAWGAHKSRSANMLNDWDYHSIAIHQAGRSFSCGNASQQLRDIQQDQRDRINADDIGYHYAIDCQGNLYEGRDIRFKGEHLRNVNTGVIGIVMLQNLSEPDEGDDAVALFKSILDGMGINQQPDIPPVQQVALEKFINVLREFFKITSLGGHKEFPHQAGDGKICPGRAGLKFVKQIRSTLAIAAP